MEEWVCYRLVIVRGLGGLRMENLIHYNSAEERPLKCDRETKSGGGGISKSLGPLY